MAEPYSIADLRAAVDAIRELTQVQAAQDEVLTLLVTQAEDVEARVDDLEARLDALAAAADRLAAAALAKPHRARRGR